eukprot:587329-Prymnesium_polylepis.1
MEPFLLAFVVAAHLFRLPPLEPKTPSTSGSPASARRSTVTSFGSSASFAKLTWIGPVSPATVVHRWSVTCFDTLEIRRPTRGSF